MERTWCVCCLWCTVAPNNTCTAPVFPDTPTAVISVLFSDSLLFLLAWSLLHSMQSFHQNWKITALNYIHSKGIVSKLGSQAWSLRYRETVTGHFTNHLSWFLTSPSLCRGDYPQLRWQQVYEGPATSGDAHGSWGRVFTLPLPASLRHPNSHHVSGLGRRSASRAGERTRPADCQFR